MGIGVIIHLKINKSLSKTTDWWAPPIFRKLLKLSFPDSAFKFNMPQENGKEIHDGLIENNGNDYELIDGFRQYTYSLSNIVNNMWSGKLQYLEIWIHSDSGGKPMVVHLKKIWLDPTKITSLDY